MTLYIVIPPRRGIASATQILVSHMFGDAFSPYLIGVLADTFKPLISPNTTAIEPEHQMNFMHSDSRQLTPEEYDLEFRALEYSLFSCCFFQVKKFFCLERSLNVFFLQALGVDASLNADAILEQMDANKDGTIDAEEWDKFMTPDLKAAIEGKLSDNGLVAGFKPLVDIARVSQS